VGDSHEPKVGVLIVAYNAEDTLVQVLDRIPDDFIEQVSAVFVCDDASTDRTFDVAVDYQGKSHHMPLHVVKHPVNLGYGGNQKHGYRWAADMGLDVVVLLHGDGQYAPEMLPEMVKPILDGEADVVFGSRMMTKGTALKGGMPLYKYVGNRILTTWENAMAGTQLSEWHSGYRAYSVKSLSNVPYDTNSDGFDFDTQIILQMTEIGARIVEIPIPTYYGDEICRVDGLKYARQVTVETLRYRLRKMGFGRSRFVQTSSYEVKASKDSSHGQLITHLGRRQKCRVLDLGCSDGSIAARLQALGHEVVGVDIEEHPGVHQKVNVFHRANLDKGLPDSLGAPFDVVLCADVIEHVRDPESLLIDIKSVLASSGNVVVSIPNFGHWYPRTKTALGMFDYDSRGILDSTHMRFFTRRSFERMVRRSGFTPRRIGVTGFPFDVLARGGRQLPRPLLAPFKLLDKVLLKLRPQLFGYQFLYELTL
jgi:glycosyltransferase involved in cell wall biosynthesis